MWVEQGAEISVNIAWVKQQRLSMGRSPNGQKTHEKNAYHP
jgi:hypothetical protein